MILENWEPLIPPYFAYPLFPFLLPAPSLFLASSSAFPAIPPLPSQSPLQIRSPMVWNLLGLW